MSKHDIELDGNGFSVWIDEDENKIYETGYKETFQPTTDTSTKRGEHSLSQWWTEKQTDWGEGEDQKWWDNPAASESKYYDSNNADISEAGEISLLKDVAASKAQASDWLPLLVARGYLWVGAGQNVYYFDGSSWSEAVSINPDAGDNNIKFLETDGQYIYAGTEVSIHQGHEGSAFTNWATRTCDGLKYMPAVGRLFLLADDKLRRLDTDGTVAYEHALGTSWQTWGIDSYLGSQIIFGARRSSEQKSFLFAYDGTGTNEVGEMPAGLTVTGLSSIDTDKVLVFCKEDATSTAAGVGTVWLFSNGELTFLGQIGDDTANKTYGPHVACRWRNDVMIGWNYQSGLYRYDMLRGGLSKNINITSVNNRVRGVQYYKGKWYFSVVNNGIYTTASTYPSAGGWVKGSITSHNVANSKILKEALVEANLCGSPAQDQSQTTDDAVGNITSSQALAQTFRAGSSKTLYKVKLKLYKTAGATEDLTVDIRTTSAGVPTDSILATQDIPAGEIPTSATVLEIAFTTPTTVTSGTTYAIVLRTTGNATYHWRKITAGAYANGAGYSDSSYTHGSSNFTTEGGPDYYFDTYNCTPTSIQLDLSLDETISYTNYGSSNSTDTFLHNISLLNISAENLTYKISLIPDSNNTETPVVKSIAIKALPKISTLARWNYWVHANEDVDPDQRTAYSIWNKLKTSYEQQQVLPFKDIDHKHTGTVHNVIIEDLYSVITNYDETNRTYTRLIRLALRGAA